MPAKSKSQQRFFGIVRSLQKGEISPSSVGGGAKEVAKTMSVSDVKDFAETKRSLLPLKAKKKKLSLFK